MKLPETVVFCVLGAILCLVLREYEKPQAALLGIAVIVVVLLRAMPEAERIVQTASALFARSSLEPSWFGLLCKAAGISWLTQIGVDLCKDCGENALSATVELCGRICLAALALPLFVTLTETVWEVIG